MAQFPALPLFTDSFLADCGHLDDTETGRYLTLLMHIWRAPECRIPNDDEWIARRFRRSVEEVQSQLRPLIREFCTTDGNWITQKRLRKEWDYLQKQRERNSVSAKCRWDKDKSASERNATSDESRNAPHPTPPTYKNGARAPFVRGEKRSGDLGADPERTWPRRAAAYGEMLRKGLSLGLGPSDEDVRRLVKEGHATREDAEKMGYSLWQ